MRRAVRLPTPPLLLISDRRQSLLGLEATVAEVLAAGCRWVSLREKDLPATEQIALARRLLPPARRHGAILTLHGDPAIAAAAGVDGVHLPAGGDARAARARLGADALVGVSIHTPEEAAVLDPAALDYAVIGPAYATASKPGYGPALAPAGIAAAVRHSRVPIVAVGGIVPDTVGDVLAAGAAGIAVMGGIMRAADPASAMRALLAACRRSARPDSAAMRA